MGKSKSKTNLAEDTEVKDKMEEEEEAKKKRKTESGGQDTHQII